MIIEGVKVVGKIDLKNIPKDSLHVRQFDVRYPKMPTCRDELDSGWGVSFILMQRNYKRYMLSIVRRKASQQGGGK